MNAKDLILTRFVEFRTLFVLFTLCCLTLLFRVKLSGSAHFLFLAWNLFLALIPLFITVLIQHRPLLWANRWTRLSLFLFWLLFFPNAPYILTDFVHLQFHHPISFVFDVILIGLFALSAFLAGLFSLRDMHQLLRIYLAKKYVDVLVGCICFLGGFGVYLGRVLRLNSWDAFLRPLYTLETVLESLSHPLCWMVILAFGLILFFGFSLIRRNSNYSTPST